MAAYQARVPARTNHHLVSIKRRSLRTRRENGSSRARIIEPREGDMRWEHLRVLLLSCCISVLAGAASAQTAKPGQGGLEVEPPRYGGSLEVGTVHVTINAISWDQGDWPWKFNHDAGNMNESLMAADLNQSIGR